MNEPLYQFGRYWVSKPDHFCETCQDTGTICEDADPDNETRCPDCKGNPEEHWRSLEEGRIENEAYDNWKDR